MFNGYVRVKKEIIYNKELSKSERLMLIMFIDRQEYVMSLPEENKDKENWFYCYIDWIVENLDIDKRTVSKSILKLQDLGYIEVSKKKGAKNMYRVNPNWIVESRYKNVPSSRYKNVPIR